MKMIQQGLGGDLNLTLFLGLWQTDQFFGFKNELFLN